MVCLAGPLAAAFDLLEPRLWKEVRSRAFRLAVEGMEIVPGRLGEDAGLLGAAWVALAGLLRQWRGVNETISSLLLGYIAIALFKHVVEGPLRDPASLNKPSTQPLAEGLRIGAIAPDSLLGDVHWGLVIGLVLCVAAGIWLSFTSSGFALRVAGGNAGTARGVGLAVDKLIVLACGLGGACAGLAGAIEVAAVHTAANASVIAGLGYTGILVSFVARHNPWAIPIVAVLFGGFAAAGSLLQRRLGLPDASLLVLQGFAFVFILAAEALRGRLFELRMPALARLRLPTALWCYGHRGMCRWYKMCRPAKR